MRSRRLKHQGWLYGLAFLLALLVRFAQLGRLPLTDMEAEWALQAMQVVQGARPPLDPTPAYILPTGLLFFLFGTSNFLARFIPALTGSALALAPALFRQRLKPAPSLLLAIVLALDPGLVALSRQAGSSILAVTFVLLAWGFWENDRPRVAGVFAGLALLSGPSMWMGLLGLGLVALFLRLMERRSPKNSAEIASSESEAGPGVGTMRAERLKAALLFGGGTVLLGGTLFFLSPNGLSAWLAALPAFFNGWGRMSGVPATRLLLALLVYQPLAVLFGLAALVRGWVQGRRRYIRLSLWLLTALLLVILYPSRQVGDLAWVLIPLWALAALEFSNHWDVFPEERREVVGMSVVVALLLCFWWLAFTGLAVDPLNPVNTAVNAISFGDGGVTLQLPPTRYLLLISILVLMAASTVMVALGWSQRLARLGSVWGLVAALGIYSLGMTWSGTGLRYPEGWELWQPGNRPAQADLLLATVNDLSEWSSGHEFAQAVNLVGIESPALSWMLRDRDVIGLAALESGAAPPIAITPRVDSLNATATYRGQDFTWRQQPAWELLTPYNWISWSVFRSLPYDSETVIVWVRNDLFIDARETLP